MPEPTVIELRDVHKIYASGDAEVKAVAGVSLTIGRGEFVAIMGASGSGKSTLMNLLGCLDQPTSGAYLLDGVDVATLPPRELALIRNRRIGFVFQSFNLLPRTSALENVELPLMYNEPLPARSEQHRRARETLERVGLGPRLHHFPSQLSGGQQQRIAIARAIVNHPGVILADEPTGNLDSRTSIEIMGLFQSMNRDGLTLVIVTHELDIAAFCKRMIVMRDGRIISDTVNTQPRDANAALAELRSAEQLARLA